MQTKVKTWGNSNAIRLSKELIDLLDIHTDDVLDVNVDGNKIILTKASTFRHKSFEERLAEYDGQIDLYEFDWGKPQGREMI